MPRTIDVLPRGTHEGSLPSLPHSATKMAAFVLRVSSCWMRPALSRSLLSRDTFRSASARTSLRSRNLVHIHRAGKAAHHRAIVLPNSLNNMQFELVSSYRPTGDQPEAIESIVNEPVRDTITTTGVPLSGAQQICASTRSLSGTPPGVFTVLNMVL